MWGHSVEFGMGVAALSGIITRNSQFCEEGTQSILLHSPLSPMNQNIKNGRVELNNIIQLTNYLNCYISAKEQLIQVSDKLQTTHWG
jgi:hypothetical protein